MSEDEAHYLETNGTLDLHHFKPSDAKELVGEFIYECRRKGICTARIIHGKGIGTLREIVHCELRKHKEVSSFELGGHGSGGWGATVVHLVR